MTDRSIRTWIWISLAAQALGYVVDALWHGWLGAGVEPATVDAMVRHLGTVHLPLYVGAASVLASTEVALLRLGRSADGATLVAFAGALLSAGSEAWHAASHLRLDTAHAAIPGTLSFVGFVVVVVAMSLSRRRR